MRNMWIAVAAVAILAVIALIVALIATSGGDNGDDATATPTQAAALPTETARPTETTAPEELTATHTATPEPPTATPEPPTATPEEPTATPEPPTPTPGEPTATPTPDDPTPTPDEPTPTPEPGTPTPVPGEQVYAANWSGGEDDWTLPDGWSVENGTLVSTGAGAANLVAPFAPTGPNYAVEVELIITGDAPCPAKVGAFARWEPVAGSETEFQSGYLAGVCATEWEIASITDTVENQQQLANGDHQLGSGEHTYRFEVEGDQLRLFIDDEFIGGATDDEYDQEGVPGIYVGGPVELTVAAFSVFELP